MTEEKPRLQLRRNWYKDILVGTSEVEDIETLDIRDDDIFVCSYPRSGTTLTQEMVFLITTGDFEKAHTVQLDERFPIMEIKDDRFPYYKGLKYIEELASPRMIKSHLPNYLLPDQLRAGKGKIIYICRNPKDVVTSFYRLMQWTDELVEGEKTFEQFTDLFVNGTIVCGPWTKHLLGYWEKSIGANVLFLKYEEVVQDLPKTIRKIAEFLKKELTDEQVEKICEYCSFDNMKKNDKCNMSYYKTFKHVNDNSEGGFMNKGKAGEWRQVLSPETSARIGGLIRELDGSGLIIPDN